MTGGEATDVGGTDAPGVDADVAVVGAGLAGSAAALAAARHRPDASVRLLPTGGPGFGDGLLRVLGSVPGGEDPVVDPLAAAVDLPEAHPYRLLGTGALRDGLALFDDVTAADYCGASTPENALVPTFHGRVTPAARYPAAVAPGLASREAATLLVGIEALADLDGPLAARRLRSAGVPFDVEGTTVSLPVAEVEAGGAVGGPGEESPALWTARALDADPAVADEAGLREALADRVRPAVSTAERVGFPAVLGRSETAEVHAALAAGLDADVFEVPLPPPHVPGLRLRDRFAAALADAGVDHDADATVAGGTTEPGGPVRVDVAGGETVRAAAVVLAAGGLASGGVVADRDGPSEPRFGCHVPHPASRLAWSDPEPFGDHPFARFGVRIDEAARPLSDGGAPEHERLFAAGRIVGGHDFAAEGSQGGVSLATAAVAGTRAAEIA